MISFFIPSILAVSLLSCGHPIEPLGREAHSRLDEAADTITLLKEAKSRVSKELLEQLRELFDSIRLTDICKSDIQFHTINYRKTEGSYGLLGNFGDYYDDGFCVSLSDVASIITIIKPRLKTVYKYVQWEYIRFLKENPEEVEKLFKFPVK